VSQDPEPPFRIIGAAPTTPYEKEVEDWAEGLREEQLTTWRSLASGWAPTVSTLLALFGAASVLGADDSVRALQNSVWQPLYGVLVGIALILGGLAIYCAYVASQPGEVQNLGPSIEERETRYAEHISRAKNWLTASRLLTVAAVIFLAGSFAVRWYAPVDPSPPAGQASAIQTPAGR
jgi:hypothetical protein